MFVTSICHSVYELLRTLVMAFPAFLFHLLSFLCKPDISSCVLASASPNCKDIVCHNHLTRSILLYQMYITRNSGNSDADKAGKTNNKRQEVTPVWFTSCYILDSLCISVFCFRSCSNSVESLDLMFPTSFAFTSWENKRLHMISQLLSSLPHLWNCEQQRLVPDFITKYASKHPNLQFTFSCIDFGGKEGCTVFISNSNPAV
jgi:hypothetical protein